jgi:hypothetical protein
MHLKWIMKMIIQITYIKSGKNANIYVPTGDRFCEPEPTYNFSPNLIHGECTQERRLGQETCANRRNCCLVSPCLVLWRYWWRYHKTVSKCAFSFNNASSRALHQGSTPMLKGVNQCYVIDTLHLTGPNKHGRVGWVERVSLGSLIR